MAAVTALCRESLTIIYSRDGKETKRIEIPEAHNIQFQTRARYWGDHLNRYPSDYDFFRDNWLKPASHFDLMLTTQAYPVDGKMLTLIVPVKPKPTKRAKSRKRKVAYE